MRKRQKFLGVRGHTHIAAGVHMGDPFLTRVPMVQDTKTCARNGHQTAVAIFGHLQEVVMSFTVDCMGGEPSGLGQGCVPGPAQAMLKWKGAGGIPVACRVEMVFLLLTILVHNSPEGGV